MTTCNRCNGLMTVQAVEAQTGHITMYRCVSCGNYEDPQVLENRTKHIPNRRY